MPLGGRFRSYLRACTQQGSLMRASIVVMFIAALVGILTLSFDVARLLSTAATASRDSEQWSLSQMEVELLALDVAILSAISIDKVQVNSLEIVRQRYDILYSRVASISGSDVERLFAESEDLRDTFNIIQKFVKSRVSLIDSSDERLSGALVDLHTEVAHLRASVRSVVLAGLDIATKMATEDRAQARHTLLVLGAITVVFILTLLAMVVALLGLDASNRRRRAEGAATLAHMAAIVATSQDAVVTFDEKFRIASFSEAASQLFEHAASDAIGQNIDELLIPSDQQALMRQVVSEVKSLRGAESARRFRITAHKKGGDVFPVEISISATSGPGARLLVTFIRDLTAEVAAEQRLLNARDKALAGERAKSDLLAIMSHEIRTPLNGLLGTIELLAQTKLSGKQKAFLKILQGSGEVLLNHVNDVLEITRHDRGLVPKVSERVDLGELASSVLENQAAFAFQRGTALELELPDKDRRTVISDSRLLKQALLNLVGNAVKFTKNGEVKLKIRHLGPDGPTEFRVEDTGIGISPLNLSRIFDDFVTVDTSYSRQTGGTGLGLGITRRAVSRLGGELGVVSRMNVGSTFFFSIVVPIVEPSPKRPRVLDCNVEPQSGRSLDILVVEDNLNNRVVLREMLSKLGHKVTEAVDGSEGILAASKRRFDMILMDISMPQVDGLQAASEIRSASGPNTSTPIIAMTAHALPRDQEKFRSAGMVGVLLKPFSMRQLCCAVNSNSEILRAMCTDDLGVLDRLKPGFLVEGEDLVEEIVDLAAKDAVDEVLRGKVHRLAGSAGMFGAMELLARLKSIETHIKENRPADARAEVQALACCWLRTKEELSKEVTSNMPNVVS